MATPHAPETETETGLAPWDCRTGGVLRQTTQLERSAMVRGANRFVWLGQLVLLVLIGLTAWVVSWVSIWWVPAYLLVVAIIFIGPTGGRTSKRASLVEDDAFDLAVKVGGRLGRVPRTDGAEGPIDHRSSDNSEAGLLIDNTTEPLESGIDSVEVSSEVGRPRRTRGRGRKSAKMAESSAPAGAAVTWIRVGPGKFVRADATASSFNLMDRTESQETAAGEIRDANEPEAAASPMIEEPFASENLATDHALRFAAMAKDDVINECPATDALADMASTEMVSTDATAEPGLLDSPGEETSSEVAAVLSLADECALSPAADGYGIAPSAFGSLPDEAIWDDDCDHDDSEEMAGFDVADDLDSDWVPAETAEPADLPVGSASSVGRHGSCGQVRLRPSAGVSRWTVNAVCSANDASLRRGIRGGELPISRMRVSGSTNRTFRHAASRVFGRAQHVRRRWRPRSPPCRS